MLRDVARALRLRAAAQQRTARDHLERGVRGGRERIVLSQAEVEILLPHVRRLAHTLQVRDQLCLVGDSRELERREVGPRAETLADETADRQLFGTKSAVHGVIDYTSRCNADIQLSRRFVCLNFHPLTLPKATRFLEARAVFVMPAVDLIANF